MPAPNVKTNSNKATMEYEVLVIPPPSPKNETFRVHQPLKTKTKRINCNDTNGSIFWIPHGFRPVLVRTTDLPLLVSSEYSPTYSPDSPTYSPDSPTYSSDSDESNY